VVDCPITQFLLFWVFCIFVNGKFFPLTSCMKKIEDVVKDLVEWYLADKSSFRFAKIWLYMLGKLLWC